MRKIYQGDVGIPITVATGLTLTGATTTAMKVKKPSGTTVTWSASIDGTNAQQMNYTSVAGDFDEAGVYYLQSYVQTGGQTLFGQTAEFNIYGPYK